MKETICLKYLNQNNIEIEQLKQHLSKPLIDRKNSYEANSSSIQLSRENSSISLK